MRIAVVGKGGSGKTTLSALLLHSLAARGWHSFGLDADFNQHLAAVLGVANANIPALADHRDSVIAYLLGTRADMTAESFTKHHGPEQSHCSERHG
jgi:CO dehydrogenase maturation factor